MEIQEFIKQISICRSNMLNQALHYLKDYDDAEDVVQETLAKLWMAKERIQNAEKLSSYASVACKNTALSFLRKTQEIISIEDITESTSGINPQTMLEENENQQKLEYFISRLSDKQRAIIKMRNVEGLSYSEIAQIIGATESSVRGIISKTRTILLKQMRGAIL